MGIARIVALGLGAIYVIVGIAGFVPALAPAGMHEGMDSATGALLGIFPINAVHNVVHLAIGAALLYGATATPAALLVSKVVGATYILVGVLGIPFPNGFGLLPLGGPISSFISGRGRSCCTSASRHPGSCRTYPAGAT